jgi:plastocyanin
VVRRLTGSAALVALGLLFAACASTSVPGSGVATPTPGSASACAVSNAPGEVQVEIRDFAFKPATISARVGQVIAFTNQDSAPHDAGLVHGNCITSVLSKGQAGGLVFSAPGSYPFHCAIHPQMTGTIEVTD